MTGPENFTAAQAADPSTPPGVLADIAALRPDLRPAVAGNPSAYPALLEWLGALGEPPVDAALRARAESAPAAPSESGTAETAVLGTAAGAPYGTAPEAPSGTAPGAPYGTAPEAPYGTAPYGVPAGAESQQPGQAAWSQPGQPGWQQQPGQPAGQQPGWGAQPGTTYGYQGTPPKKGGSSKVLWIVLGVVGVLIALGIAGVFIIRGLIDSATPDTYGDDQQLDQLWDACEAEDWQACDDLYLESPRDSEYERFGDTCGNRTDGGSYCVDEFSGQGEEEPSEGEADAYGDDPELDALWDACDAEDWQACDDLFFQAPAGSQYEEFGGTCGNRTDGQSLCTTELGGGDAAGEPGAAEGEPMAFGDDPELDALWTACEGGDGQACDDLWWAAPVGSEYEQFGSTCGGREAEGTVCTP